MTDQQRKEAIQAYHAATTFMDAQVGRVLESLEHLGLRENTIVVFTSDHGYHLGEHGLWKKQSLFEQSARVPMIISVPGYKEKARQTNSLSELVDLYPTLASLCDLPIPQHVMGTDLSPLLKKPKNSLNPIALTQVMRVSSKSDRNRKYKGHTIRTARYRYTEWDRGEQGIELYDHKTDPEEMHNLAGNPAKKNVQQKMEKLLNDKLDTLQTKNLERLN